MGDFEDKINGLLQSPESLEQIMRLARSLSGESEAPEAPHEEKDARAESAETGGRSMPSCLFLTKNPLSSPSAIPAPPRCSSSAPVPA